MIGNFHRFIKQYNNNIIKTNIINNRVIINQNKSFCSINNKINNENNDKKLYTNILMDLRDNHTKNFTQKEVEKYIQLEQDILVDNQFLDYYLGLFYSQGILVEKDEEKALKYFEKSADSNNSKGLFSYGLSLIIGSTQVFEPLFPTLTNKQINKNYDSNNKDDEVIIGDGWVSQANVENKDFNYRKWLIEERKKSQTYKQDLVRKEREEAERIKKGMRLLNLSAIQNLPIAQYQLGNILLKGLHNIEKNEKQGLYWLEVASNDYDNIKATLELGKYYLEQYQITQKEENLLKAIQYLSKASKEGDSEAPFIIGSTFLGNENYGIDSIEYIKQSVERGHKAAPTFLALLYMEGVAGLEHSIDQFKHYLEIGLERNDSLAHLVKGELYFKGDSVFEQSYKKALHHFTISSNLGHPEGFINQGVCFFHGYGTEINYEKSFYCYQNAFNLNPQNIAAISNLYNMHKNGLGVPKNPEVAEYYLNLIKKIEGGNIKTIESNNQ
ncbi:hypothetical protein DICPUDRAFT_44399 [Dictyostelium purpureum]|uniref:Uncharacterized protein n=1 Tax=Dictyostelium purpureum TaxID=5786 RepID=F1A658_DICPU|nr:uncharacterized protein DICPUDRAFT_44399 [Dictyostelium purpureum]EGC28324.1 hypothetical protein DICPUDRAFT_44399 [Dictyostelium purpureum]|eukprot:XP_003295152.1 hypothetical protein DICPUDRAFT_44399 [Dictyostelium purpureum]